MTKLRDVKPAHIYSLDLYLFQRSMAQEACTSTKAEGEAHMISELDHEIVTETKDEEISTLKKKIHALQRSN